MNIKYLTLMKLHPAKGQQRRLSWAIKESLQNKVGSRVRLSDEFEDWMEQRDLESEYAHIVINKNETKILNV